MKQINQLTRLLSISFIICIYTNSKSVTNKYFRSFWQRGEI